MVVETRGACVIEEIAIPESLDAPNAADFVEAVKVGIEIEAGIVGNYDLAEEPPEQLPRWQDPYESRRMFVARVDGRIVGRATHEVQSGEPKSAWVFADVLPEHRRSGIGTALAARVEQIAIDDGRSVLQSFAMHPGDAEDEQLNSPTGFGSVPRHDDAVRFLLSRGYRLAQVERASQLNLPTELAPLTPVAGYELELWEGATPEHRLDDMAELHARMSTDAPFGEIDYEAEEWDAERVRSADRLRASSPVRWLIAVARDVESDTLAGFTELVVPAETDRPVFQADTLVRSEHRGHRLGMLLKLANLHRLAEVAPGHPSIYTWNAEENRHMLSVNEALGFEPVGYPSNWRRDLYL